jgi:hypothetical protein
MLLISKPIIMIAGILKVRQSRGNTRLGKRRALRMFFAIQSNDWQGVWISEIEILAALPFECLP